ncbi:MAG: mechanosensitive ion channel [Gemmatimonadetes bacterium]|nr:mechanosensitive ion channel [Gemmatimonadota bacterium]
MLESLWGIASQRGVVACAALAVIWAAVKLIQRRLAAHVGTDFEWKYRSRRIVGFAGMLVAALVLLAVFGDALGQLPVTLGVAGAGIAFALREVIASVAGWIAILTAGFYRAGDRVQLGRVKGDVIDIGMLRTTLMEVGEWVDGDLYNGRIVRLANSIVFKEPVFNYSSDFPFVWDEIRVPVRFGSDYGQARSLLDGAVTEVAGQLPAQSQETWVGMVSKYRIENARTTPWVTLAFNDNWVEFNVRYVVGYKNRRAVRDALFTRILRDIEATLGKVTLASATFQLVDLPPLNVRLERSASP